jgi:uncharacterized membrane protein YdbT with pleckstrin-like domain
MPKSYLESLVGENEKIILIDRQHIFILIRAIFLEIVLFAFILAAGIIITVLFQQTLKLFPIVVALVLCLVPFLGALRDIMIWYNREYIVTNRRVIQISGVFNKDVTDSSLDKVNDVKMDQTVLGRLFDYGDIEILTASELGANLFRHIGKPIRFKTAMLNAKEELEHGRAEPAKEGADIPSQIYRLDQLRQKGVISEEEFQMKKKELLAKL